MNKYLMCAAPAAMVVAGAAMAQAMTQNEYLMVAGASDLYERQSSQLVLDSTADPALRAFAREMIAAHTQSTAEVKAAAKRAKIVVPPPMLTPAQREMIAQLQALTGAERDARYIAQQRAAHGQALAVQKAYATGGTVPALRAAAAKIVPVVEHHIMMLKMM